MTNPPEFCYQSYVKMFFLVQFGLGFCSGFVQGCTTPLGHSSKEYKITSEKHFECQTGFVWVMFVIVLPL
jgi:hypothetical protein